jgi:CRP-like cAMP-binding protein
MENMVKNVRSPLFAGIEPTDMEGMLGCIGYHVRSYQKGEIIAFEEENINHVGVVLEGTVDMVKEDVWGNRTMLLRTYREDIFGETFACGEDSLSVVTFVASRDCKVLFLSFCRVMHTCTHACVFHQTLIENMVRIIARKNRELMRKVEVVSKRTIREKLLAYLSLQAQQQDSRYFEIPLGRVELAEYLCVDRSALTRELVKMKEDGLIDYHKNCFRIL